MMPLVLTGVGGDVGEPEGDFVMFLKEPFTGFFVHLGEEKINSYKSKTQSLRIRRKGKN
jgi:hypothetical protein